MADNDRNHAYRSSPQSQSHPHWTMPSNSHSHHGTPAQEHGAFNFGPSMPMEPSAFSNNMQQRSMHHHLQPLVMPQWPSMLNSQPTYQHYPPPVQPIQSMPVASIHTPLSATSTRSTSTPRKTLTDLDRKRMCQYAEEHPNSKQTEIGAIFGVERSTVSKVLRQKEKYLCQDDGSRSPVKRAKGRSPDIERALAVWAKNQEKKGNPLTDDLIRAQARAFAATTTTADNHTTLSSSWLEKFKLKNNLLGARSRKTSLAPDDPENPTGASSSSHTPGDVSPTSPTGLGSPSPIELHSTQSHESLNTESPDDYLGFSGRHGPLHSQSQTSLNSAFTDAAASSFSPRPLSPTSPFFTPDSGTAPSPFVPQYTTARPILPTSSTPNSHRPRSQTVPLLDQYSNGPEEGGHSNYGANTALDSPMEESSDPLVSLNEAMCPSGSDARPPTVTPSETMRPPPLPSHVPHSDGSRSAMIPPHPTAQQPQTTPEEARRALTVVLTFFQQHGSLDFNESVIMGKLMDKLKLHP